MKIYIVEITPKLLQSMCQVLDVLSPIEKTEIALIGNNQLKMSIVVSKVLKRYLLSEYCDFGILPAYWEFEKTIENKPYTVNSIYESKLFFNVSHCEDIFAIAISSKDEVGLDIESYHYKIDDRLAQTVFTDSEIVKLQRSSILSKQMHYLRLWTIKEAYAKYLGLGIGLDFKGLDIVGRSESYYAAMYNNKVQPNHIYNKTICFSGKSYALSVTHKEINLNQTPHIIEFDSRRLMKLLSK
ncbi:phosphopantetheinyl transferase [Ancylomarina subtilis]|uniref:Phosphopantetheinyl transferase n=1 Tax=Ancylomarina subtilis TaxID=1639035 RepID=A0A4Q7V802_9BACT|nr:4'-phosphopantetheinyl transferase superfamily protein [Ancylomarina subtilis]RZT91747.1 phosphopantetheinyl transferase [Ancylomarina subtilis]